MPGTTPAASKGSWGIFSAYGSAAAQRIDNITFNAAPRAPAVLPHQVGLIPPRAQSFRPRAEAERLRDVVGNGGTAVLCQVLTGMGGVGKTQLAADYAHHIWDSGQVELLVWVTAASRSAVVAGYAQAGVEVCQADDTEPERAAQRFLAWLRAKKHRWLVVLDDLADPKDLQGLWPPDAPHGRTLVTTRRRDAILAGADRRQIRVGLFSESEASAYLTDVLTSHGLAESRAELAGLAAQLGHLPLALSQAAAHLADEGMSVASFRALLADRTLAEAVPNPEYTALPDDQTSTVAAVWSMSVDRADKLPPVGLARPLLQLMAMLDPNGIPAAVLTSSLVRSYLSAQYRVAANVSAEEVTGVLRTLHRLSLIEHNPHTPHRAVRVHALIQRATRDALNNAELTHQARTAADALVSAWPEIERDTDLSQALRANATELTRLAEDALFQFGAHPLLHRAGDSLGSSGQATAAVDYHRRLVAAATGHLGADHPDTLIARGYFARWRGQAGNAAGAVADLEKLLSDYLRVMGPDEPETLATRGNLALWRGAAGDAAGGVAAINDLLTDCVRLLGADHHRTLSARAYHARSRGQAGDAKGAATEFAALITDHRRMYGSDHPDTLTYRQEHAYWSGECGDVAAAVRAFRELLADRLRVMGRDHPDTLITRANLAYWQGETGDSAGAGAQLEALLADRLRVVGPDDPHTLITRSLLARKRGESGDVTGAVSAFEELLADRLRVLRPDHPDTLTTRAHLARWRGESGDTAGAMAGFEALLGDRLRVLSPEHPHTLTTRHELAYWQGQSGDVLGARAAFEALLADRLRVLGPDHPDTLTTRAHLARCRGESGDTAGAVAALKVLLADRLRVLGPDHPHIGITQAGLARWLAGSVLPTDREIRAGSPAPRAGPSQ